MVQEIPFDLVNALLSLALVAAVWWAWNIAPVLGVGTAALALALWLIALRQLFTGARGRLWMIFLVVDILLVPLAACSFVIFGPFI